MEFHLLDLISVSEVMPTRLDAMKNLSKEVYRKEIGKFLGGKMTIEIVFDEREKVVLRPINKIED